MKIKVNGEEKSIKELNKECSLFEVLNQLGFKNKTIIVELNNLIVNHESWHDRKVKEGDKLEIVSIVGGG